MRSRVYKNTVIAFFKHILSIALFFFYCQFVFEDQSVLELGTYGATQAADDDEPSEAEVALVRGTMIALSEIYGRRANIVRMKILFSSSRLQLVLTWLSHHEHALRSETFAPCASTLCMENTIARQIK